MFDDGDADYDDDDDWGLADQPDSDDDDDDDDGAIVIRGRGANRARIVPDSDSESPPPARPTTRSTNPVPLDATDGGLEILGRGSAAAAAFGAVRCDPGPSNCGAGAFLGRSG